MRSARLFISKHTRQNTLWDNDTTEITWDRNSSSEDYDVLAGHFPSSSTWTLAIFKYRVMAAFDRLRFLLQQCLFNYSGSVYLASSSGSLNPYETILINTLRLATSEWLTSLRVSFRPLSTLSGAVFAFLYVRRSWTFSRFFNREMHYHCAITTYRLVLLLLLHMLLAYRIQHDPYLLSCGLLSRILRSVSMPVTTHNH